jgi:hypothetical protein
VLRGALEPSTVQEAKLGARQGLGVRGEKEESLKHAEQVMHGDEEVRMEGGGLKPGTDTSIHSYRGCTECLQQ